MRQYLQFVLKERRLLSFGLTFTFFSNFGQTFLISLFVPFFVEEFALSNAGFGSLYSMATLVSACSLPYLGQWIDHLPLKRFSILVAMGLMLAAFTLSVSWHVSILFIGLLMLRLAGQGLGGHTAQTAMAKFFDYQRGKALSIASLGYPIGEALLPLLVTALLPFIGWRYSWGGISLCIGILLIPFISSILREDAETETPSGTTDTESPKATGSYKMVLQDRRFLFIAPAALLPAFWATGLFLYQVTIAPQLGWTATLVASAFVGHAIARIISSLAVGPLIDRFSARAVFPYHLLPLGVGLFMACWHPGNWSAFAYMFLLGMTLGMSSNIKSALWAEMYGTKSVGTVRSLFSSLVVFGSALSPFIMGSLLDAQVPMTHILIWAITTVGVASVLAFLAFRR